MCIECEADKGGKRDWVRGGRGIGRRMEIMKERRSKSVQGREREREGEGKKGRETEHKNRKVFFLF